MCFTTRTHSAIKFLGRSHYLCIISFTIRPKNGSGYKTNKHVQGCTFCIQLPIGQTISCRLFKSGKQQARLCSKSSWKCHFHETLIRQLVVSSSILLTRKTFIYKRVVVFLPAVCMHNYTCSSSCVRFRNWVTELFLGTPVHCSFYFSVPVISHVNECKSYNLFRKRSLRNTSSTFEKTNFHKIFRKNNRAMI